MSKHIIIVHHSRDGGIQVSSTLPDADVVLFDYDAPDESVNWRNGTDVAERIVIEASSVPRAVAASLRDDDGIPQGSYGPGVEAPTALELMDHYGSDEEHPLYPRRNYDDDVFLGYSKGYWEWVAERIAMDDREQECPHCAGDGHEPGAPTEDDGYIATCGVCRGAGTVSPAVAERYEIE